MRITVREMLTYDGQSVGEAEPHKPVVGAVVIYGLAPANPPQVMLSHGQESHSSDHDNPESL